MRYRFSLLVGLLTLVAPAGAQTLDIYRKIFQQASQAIEAGEWDKCAGLFASAAEAAPYDGQSARSYFAAAACSAAKGDKEKAFGFLDKAADKGHRDVERAEANPDVEPLRQDPRWKKFLAGVKERSAAHEARLNAELTRLYEEDQKDRSMPANQTNWTQVGQRDADRKKRVLEITGQGAAKEAEDYFHAAMVFQHGTNPEDFKRAHDLCLKAIEIDPANDDVRWLAAASMDRYLMYKGEPQLYGTQIKKTEDGKWILWTVDPTITDEERARWDVPPLAAAKERARQKNGGG